MVGMPDLDKALRRHLVQHCDNRWIFDRATCEVDEIMNDGYSVLHYSINQPCVYLTAAARFFIIPSTMRVFDGHAWSLES